MERLTTNKDVSEMGMFELAHNSCYIKDGVAKYRDFEIDMNARDLARKLMVQYGHWKSCEKYGLDSDNELLDDDFFDDTMMENLMHEPNENIGLIALFYRNLWAMADLRERLKIYEDADEQGLLLRFPCKEVYESDGDTVYYIFEDEIAECVSCGVSIDCDGKLLLTLVCEEKIFPYRLPDAEHDTEPTEWCDNVKKVSVDEWNKTVFITKEAAEQALKKMESEG